MKKIVNILLGVMVVITAVLVAYAIATNGSDASISANLIWGYFLFAAGVASAIFCALFGMVQNPATIKSSLLMLGLVVVVILVAAFVANGHTYQIPDLANNSYFERTDTVISDASILVTYVVFGVAIVTTIATEIWNAFK